MKKKFDLSRKYKSQYLSKNLKMYVFFVEICYIPMSVNKRVHITEKTAFMTKSIFSLFTYLQFLFCFEN